MQADKSALGTLPLKAYQHCEAVRAASGLGWYIFPPKSACLKFDGSEILIIEEGSVRPIRREFLGEEFTTFWRSVAPPEYADQEITWIEALQVPGALQIWSGFFVTTEPDWQIWIKPLTNVHWSSALWSYEGLVRTDLFQPAPLFANFQVLRTGQEIIIDARYPLFQVIALPVGLEDQPQHAEIFDIGSDCAPAFDWVGFGRTSRDERHPETVGRYGASIRRDGRKGG